jgi:copper chaperone CopZ
MSYYIHDIPGRLRVKSPSIKRNRSAAEEVERLIGNVYGVDRVNVNLTTGSLLVNYNPKTLKYHDIVNMLQAKGYFDYSKAVTNDQYIHNAASKVSELAITVLTSFV